MASDSGRGLLTAVFVVDLDIDVTLPQNVGWCHGHPLVPAGVDWYGMVIKSVVMRVSKWCHKHDT